MMTTEKLLFSLLKNEVFGEKLPEDFDLADKAVELYRLSKRHDVAHLIGDALLCNNLLPSGKVLEAFRRRVILAVYRYEQQNAVFEEISEAFSAAKIPFVPLKGSALRDYYPQPWMRTSCDVDVLVKDEDLERAKSSLLGNGFTTDGVVNYHDVSFYKGGVHIELHFSVLENFGQADDILSKVWDCCEPVSEYEYRESSVFFAFHHIAHMAYHFISGGCGLRPFMDLYIMRQRRVYDDNELIALLKRANLATFYRYACDLSDVWFGSKTHLPLTAEMEKYILKGGAYGSVKNAEIVGSAESSGRGRYLLKMAFLPYKNMCVLYPPLKKRKALLPFYYVHRIITKLFGKDRKRIKAKIDSTMSNSQKNVSAVKNMLAELGLKK